MNKKTKKIFQKDKDKEKTNKPPQKPKLKINIEKNAQFHPKPQDYQLKITKVNTEAKKNTRNIKVHNSIGSKEEVKKKISPNKIRNKMSKQNLTSTNTFTNNNRLFSSNLFLTNDTDFQVKEEDKKVKKNKNIKNYSSNGDKKKFPELNKNYKKSKFKKTIIIDNEGNNNLNLKLSKGDNDYKNILNNNNEKNISVISSSLDGNTETNSLFEASNQSYMKNFNYDNNKIKNKDSDIRQTIIDKNEEEKRLKEYNKIFNLLNSNIEQFKKMFISSNNNNNNIKSLNNKNTNNNHINTNLNKNKKIIIASKQNKKNNKYLASSSHSKHKNIYNFQNKKLQSNIKKNLSQKNLYSINKFNKNNKDLFSFDLNDDSLENCNNGNNKNDKSNNYSFLESSIQDDFYQCLINQTFLQNISHISFEINTDEISNVNNNIDGKINNKISLTENNNKNNEVLNTDLELKNKSEKKKKLKYFERKAFSDKNQIVDKNISTKQIGNNCKTEANINKNNCLVF